MRKTIVSKIIQAFITMFSWLFFAPYHKTFCKIFRYHDLAAGESMQHSNKGLSSFMLNWVR